MDAMAHLGGPRELIIRSKRYGEREILVSVQDRGRGVAEENAEKIFEPFFSTRPRGTGLGLVICRSIVEAHDGRLWFANAAEGGSIFQFTVRTQS
jgi:signal transduction histidine kinase